MGLPNEHVVEQSWVNEVRNLHARIIEVSPKHPDIARALMQFRLVSCNPAHTLYPLGLFAVLELLLTHDPHGNYDSLSHQIRTKIPLLERRFDCPIDYSVFTDSKKETVWKKLYEYRSAIAHGGALQFDRGLSVLKDAPVARGFLEEATKAVLRHALKEPELVLDLRSV